ncbi:MAG: hypothetical protein U1A78_30800 [Polyangia bacterium]
MGEFFHDEDIEARLRAMSPAGAHFYVLHEVVAPGRTGARFPPSGLFRFLAPFQPPLGVPTGTYLVEFFHANRLPIHARPASIRLTAGSAPSAAPQPQPAQQSVAQGALPHPPAAAQQALPPHPSYHGEGLYKGEPPRPPLARAVVEHPTYIEAEVDYRVVELSHRTRAADERAARDSVYTGEIGEMSQLNRMARESAQQAMSQVQAVSERMLANSLVVLENANKSVAMIGDLLDRSRDVTSKLNVPPAPPDTAGTLKAAGSLLLPVALKILDLVGNGRSGGSATPEKRPLPSRSHLRMRGRLASRTGAGASAKPDQTGSSRRAARPRDGHEDPAQTSGRAREAEVCSQDSELEDMVARIAQEFGEDPAAGRALVRALTNEESAPTEDVDAPVVPIADVPPAGPLGRAGASAQRTSR